MILQEFHQRRIDERALLGGGDAVSCALDLDQLRRTTGEAEHACTVFVSRAANPLKVDALRRFRADVRVAGDDFDAAKDAARAHA